MSASTVKLSSGDKHAAASVRFPLSDRLPLLNVPESDRQVEFRPKPINNGLEDLDKFLVGFSSLLHDGRLPRFTVRLNRDRHTGRPRAEFFHLNADESFQLCSGFRGPFHIVRCHTGIRDNARKAAGVPLETLGSLDAGVKVTFNKTGGSIGSSRTKAGSVESEMTEFEEKVLTALDRIADALEAKPGKAPKAKAAKVVGLFGENEDRAIRGKKPVAPMPEEFHLNAKLREFAANHGFARCDFMFDQFKAHHRAKGSVFADWEAAWRTWVLNQVKFSGNAPQQPRPTNGVTDGRI